MGTALVQARCVALTIHEDRAWALRWDHREQERRAFATERVCQMVAMGMVEAAERAVSRLLEPSLGRDVARAARLRSFPGYCYIRDFLIGELDADPIIAARVAASQTAFHNRFAFSLVERAPSIIGRREIGWH